MSENVNEKNNTQPAEIRVAEVRPLFSPERLATYLDVDKSCIRKFRRTRRIPPPDLRIGNRPRWKFETIESIVEQGIL